MAQKYPFVKVNVTPGEKRQIEMLARQHNMSASAFVKSYLSPILRINPEVDAPYDYEPEERDLRVEIRVSENEMKTIKEKAGAKSVASYVRNTALNGSKTLRIEVYDDDIVDLMHRVQPQIDTLFGVVKALQLQKQLQPAQYTRLEELLYGISKDIRNVVSNVRKNRNSIRQTRLRELRRRCNAAIKSETDSLACFESDDEITY